MRIDPTAYRKTFFDEAIDHLAALEGALLRLEKGADSTAVDEAFRAAHSVKGGADAVGFPHIAKFTHSVEGFLERFRAGGQIPRRGLDLLLEATDVLARLVSAARHDEPPPEGTEELVARLAAEAAAETETAPEATSAGAGARASKSWWESPKELDLLKPEPAEPRVAAYTVTVTPHPEALRSGLDPLPLLRELAQLGTLGRVELNLSELPALADLDPERCYLSWKVHLETAQPLSALADVFAFSPDMISATVAPAAPAPVPASAAAPPPAPAAPPPPAPERPAPTPPPPSQHSAPMPPRIENPGASLFGSFERRLPVPDPVRFASFLAKRGAITADQGLDALVRQRDGRPTTAAVAVQTGHMTVEQLKNMVEWMGPDEGFGEAAVRLEYLTADDLGRILLRQEQTAPPLSECLTASGALSGDALARELAAYHTQAATTPTPAASFSELPPVEMPRTPGESLLDENGAMIGDFCAEASEHLETADRHLLTIDGDPTNASALNAVYRGFHTIKGVSSMLGLSAVQMLAHEAENLLNLAREGKVVLQGKPMDLVFASTDGLKRQVQFIRQWAIERGKLTEDPALPKLLSELRASVGGQPAASAHAPRSVAPAPPAPAAAAPTAPAPAPKATDAHPEPAERAPAPAPAPKADAHPEPAARRAPDKETVRVDKDRLDKLINTIGELVIAQSMAQQEFDELNAGEGVLSLALPELSKISRDLQELSLSLRMVPMQGTFQKMARLVRDLSRKMDKPVELELHGEETELDKTVVDQLGDPLMHMVRNAIDHGLEDTTERAAAGKPTAGRVTLRAYHQGGSVFIELTDDGKGLDRERILRKAVEKGIIAEGQRLMDSEIYALIFEAGFSTAKAVTDVSGRGVGMDVVRRNVEALQGNILIRTQLGHGTTFTIRLPLTLAIMDGLVVGLGGEVYVLPLLSVVESFRPRPTDVHRVAGRGEAVTVRGEVVPLLRLHEILGRPSEITDPCRGLVVLVEDQGKKHAVLVDELLGQMQAVVKSLDANYRRVEGLAGATILGDGRVAMILDIHGLAQLHTQFGRGAPEPALASVGSDNFFGA
ncbi:Hpt domain-containing protein [Gemmata sp. G18]|uniref:Chemotaxis protein CheA n=1 Tax=Gemmata palustris TaxID=2822762 RepID=A0ABS5C467_9BACT|nr:chemotaxis protein CheA [Gemmata palustris]MBP3960630.1 Hpt domain-containing protein [Gemmata palustris]